MLRESHPRFRTPDDTSGRDERDSASAKGCKPTWRGYFQELVGNERKSVNGQTGSHCARRWTSYRLYGEDALEQSREPPPLLITQLLLDLPDPLPPQPHDATF